MSNSDEMKDEYPEELIRSGVRAKYRQRYEKGSNIVVIDADLVKRFPDSKAVNDALRQFLAEHEQSD
jgi:uncharacterized protein (DUF4415 family)